jgi:hypothetical protein
MIVHLAILRSARLLVPAPQRAEWFAEWSAELCYIERACESRALVFCLGAYQDAFWIRRESPGRALESPLQCFSMLAIVALLSLLAAGRAALVSPFRDARGLVESSTVSVEQYESLYKPLPNLAFFQRIDRPVPEARRAALLSIIRGSRNLFDVLHIPVQGPASIPTLILSREAWATCFGGDRRIIGRVLEVAGQRALVAGVIADDAWPLAGGIDAWLLDDTLPTLPGGSEGFVVGRVTAASGLSRWSPPARRLRNAFQTFAFALFLGCIILPVTTSVALGAGTRRQWVFLLAKVVPVLTILYCCASLGFSCNLPFALIFRLAVWPGSVVAFRWILTDQRQRCPVCLRLLSDPVTCGEASHTFLGWYGTELTCGRGHGVMQMPAISSSGFREQRWVDLEELCLSR